MMKSIITEKGITFKDLEKKIYTWVCRIGQEFTREFLERYDQVLMKERDKEKYRHKGTRQTTVKTVYGEVMYEREVYQVTEEDGSKRFVYLLDETLELGRVGLVHQYGAAAGEGDHGAVVPWMCERGQQADRADDQRHGRVECDPGPGGENL